MNFLEHNRLAATVHAILSGDPTAKPRRDLRVRPRRWVLGESLACEMLEARLVLSSGGGSWGAAAVIQDLNELGIVTSPAIAGTAGTASTNSSVAQLQTDQQTLAGELQTLSSKSNVTTANLTSLLTDSQALGQAWYGVDSSQLEKAVSDLAAAATGSTTVSTTSATSEFAGLFPSSDSAAASTVANDLSTIIGSSAVTASDLGAVASDEAAIQKDSSALSPFAGGGYGLGAEGSIAEGEGLAASAITSALENLGVIASPGAPGPTATSTSTNPALTQLQTDEQTLENELQNLTAASGVTIGALTKLSLDSQALDQAIQGISPSSFQQAVSDLASAATGSTTVSTSSATSEFTGLFPSADQSAAATVAGDVITLVGHSGVTAADLNTVASETATVQTDLNNLQNGNSGSGGHGGWGGGGGGGSAARRSLTSILNNLGVMTSQINSTPTNPPTSANPLVAQLQNDEEAFETELDTLAGKSGVTTADLTQLSTDSQALNTPINGVTSTALQQAVSDLASAATGSTTVSVSSATSEFAGLFPGSDATAADTVAADLITIINHSGVTATDLTTVASDQTAIQNDLNNLQSNFTSGGSFSAAGGSNSNTLISGMSSGSGSGSGGGTGGSGSGSGSGTGSSGTIHAASKARHPRPPRHRHRAVRS